MEALKDTPTPRGQEASEPAEQAGVFLETVDAFPIEFSVILGASARLNALKKEHGSIQPKVRQSFDSSHRLTSNSIDVYLT